MSKAHVGDRPVIQVGGQQQTHQQILSGMRGNVPVRPATPSTVTGRQPTPIQLDGGLPAEPMVCSRFGS